MYMFTGMYMFYNTFTEGVVTTHFLDFVKAPILMILGLLFPLIPKMYQWLFI